jgi:peptidyl-prolyl cis-trans isomerase C
MISTKGALQNGQNKANGVFWYIYRSLSSGNIYPLEMGSLLCQVKDLVYEPEKGYPFRHTEEEARKLAEDVIAELKQGRDFAELAGEKSEDSGTRTDGGLFIFAEGEAVEAFARASHALKDGEYTTSPVKTEYGFHVIKREKVIPAGVQPFEEVRQQLTEKLTNEAKENRFSSFMMEAKSKADIVNNLAEDEGNSSNG